jgi:hypothetical protein
MLLAISHQNINIYIVCYWQFITKILIFILYFIERFLTKILIFMLYYIERFLTKI